MIKLSDLRPYVWATPSSSIYITQLPNGQYSVYKHGYQDDEMVIKEYDEENRYWRHIGYESKYDVVYFDSLDEAIRVINLLEYPT